MLIKGVQVVLPLLERNKFRNISSLRKLTTNMTNKTALIFLASGTEEMELTIAADVLRRGGLTVTIAGLCESGEVVKCSRDVNIKRDVSLKEVKGPFDILVCPGGLGGSEAMSKCTSVGAMLKKQEEEGRWIATICAATTVLKAHGIAKGKKVTSYPAMKNQLTSDYNYQEEDVVVDDHLITSRGPGTAFAFALTIVENLVGKAKAQEVAKAMLVSY